MATLANAKLNIQVNLPVKTAFVVVTGSVIFTQLENFLMQNGLRFKLDCKIWGEDNGQDALIDPDDFLFSYPTIFFPDASPTVVEAVKFERTVPLNILQEDSGTDEIYGELIMTNLESFVRVKKRTNLIVQQIG